ncbi:type II toxin-antitoxin system VapB family antitoxin [Nevskia sp.]|uniref:type II toxin-antitoxin system VapB family antitoxin n=1 Tax=Nevskia sp. TaxID=1929292 RepID=UPI0025D101DE|nr:type II toxin-antitoxin system VapB family antitoxin [Nevskia sp.]
MRTNIDIDDDLMNEAMAATGARTKKQAVEDGLRLLVRMQRQQELRSLRGKVVWEGNLEVSRLSVHEPYR